MMAIVDILGLFSRPINGLQIGFVLHYINQEPVVMHDLHTRVEDATLRRFNASQDRTARDQGYGATKGALGVTKRYCGPLSAAIAEALANASPKQSAMVYVLKRLPSDLLAAATLRVLLHHIALCDVLTRTAQSLGLAIEAECWAAGLLCHDAHLYGRVERAAKKKHGRLRYRRQAARSIAQRAGYRVDGWTAKQKVTVGVFLIECAIQALPDVFECPQIDNRQYLPGITRHGLDVAEEAVEEALRQRPVFLPSTEPLAPWTGFRDGGYWSSRDRFNTPIVRVHHKATVAAIKGALRAGSMAPHVAGLNALQDVPWVINRRILEIIKWADECRVPIPGLPPVASKELPGRLKDEEAKDKDKRYLQRHRISQVKEHNLGLRGKRVLLAQDISTAEMLGTQRFFTPYNCDWRGRVYAVPHFNFSRDDRVRAMFLFAEGMPIGEEGLWWLKVHVANCGDFDKISKRPLEERVAWVDQNLPALMDVAQNPWSTAVLRGPMNWSEADKPFLFLAACFELSASLKHGPTYMTRLPVSFDGSCSGLQHLCAMTRASEGSLVNLTDQPLPQDVYQTVADLVLLRVTADACMKDTHSTPAEGVSAGVSAGLAKLCLDYGITRKLVKRNVMTYSYSSKVFGMSQQHMTDLMKPLSIAVLAGSHESHPFGDDEGLAASKYLARQVYTAIEEVVKLPAEAMHFLQRCARALAHEGKPLSWVTPTGLPWSNRYHETSVDRVWLWLNDTPIRLNVAGDYTPTINKDKCANGVAPNFVHALDAAHLILTVNACVAEGITNIATVHDSFGCLAPQAKRFNEIIREQFVEMYETHDVLQEVLDAATRDLTLHNRRLLPKLPAKGPLDIRGVLNARYCFA